MFDAVWVYKIWASFLYLRSPFSWAFVSKGTMITLTVYTFLVGVVTVVELVTFCPTFGADEVCPSFGTLVGDVLIKAVASEA